MGEEKARVSAEISRPAAAPILPTVNPAAEKQAETSSALHPSVYVMFVHSLPYVLSSKCWWFFLALGYLSVQVLFCSTSGSCLLSGFVCCQNTFPNPLLTLPRLPHSPDSMASYICNHLDSNLVSNYKYPRRSQISENEWKDISESDRPHRSLLQLEFDLRKPYIFVLECLIYPND